MKVIDCKQGSPEWSAARLGVVTASEIDALITPLWKVRTGEGVETYRFQKLCEKLLGYTPDDGSTFAMNQGEILEKIARPWFAFEHNVSIETPGFCVSDDGRIGCSPDGLIGDDCGLEIKAPQPPQHLKYLMAGEVPTQYRPQVHFSMLVTGRPRWIFVSYSRQFPPLVVEVKRNEEIQGYLHEALDKFFQGFEPILAKVKGWKDAENAAKAAAHEAAVREFERTGKAPA
jgi:hypothetical protein